MKSLRVLTFALLTLSLLWLTAPASAATTPSATLTVTVTPDSGPAGSSVTVSGSLTNTSSKTEKFTIKYTVTGPCNYSETSGLAVTERAGETQQASVTRTIPTCSAALPQTYTITGSVYAGSTLVTAASAAFTVNS